MSYVSAIVGCTYQMRVRQGAIRGGDIIIFPHDAVHLLSSSMERPSHFGIQDVGQVIPMDQANPGTALLCGFLEIDHPTRSLLLGSLPDVMVINDQAQPHSGPIDLLLGLLFAEAAKDTTATAAILDRLADALLFYLIRDLSHKNLPVPGLLGALEDSHVSRAILAIHANPESHWTLESLAKTAHLSRSVFAERFVAACGMPAIEFLTFWRMYLARRWLENEKVSVMEAAGRCGYESVAAFSKAFKRVMGAGPGQFRKIGRVRD